MIECRSFGVDLRADGDLQLSGVVVRYGAEADLRVFRERILPGAFNAEDVLLNIQHDRGRPIARTGAGLVLTDSDAELRMAATLPDTRHARDAMEGVRAGLLRGLSVEMEVREQDWEDAPGGGALRVVKGASLLGVALVDRPAYHDSTVEARAREVFNRRPLPPPKRFYL